jgi:hypothetical protein
MAKTTTTVPAKPAPASHEVSTAPDQMRVGGSHKDLGKVRYGGGMMRF